MGRISITMVNGLGSFVHDIDPIILSIDGVNIWWYGLSFTFGFLNAHIFLRRNRGSIGISLAEVYDLTLFLAIGVLIGGRALVVVNNEWPFYRNHLELIPAIWIGGFATHGLIFGGATGVLLFCFIYRLRFRPVLDLLAISACIILGFGRIGNFIDGQIYGRVTDVPWAVKFPNIDGFRHPVVLYDGLKNFLLVPVLLWIRRLGVPPGRVAAFFVILYAGLRIPIDLLREYPITTLGLPTGQTLNIAMLLFGIVILVVNIYRSKNFGKKTIPRIPRTTTAVLWPRKIALAACCLVPLVIPSDATRDIPVTYSARHAGLEHSWMYPAIAADLAAAAEEEK